MQLSQQPSLDDIPQADRTDKCHLELIRGVGYSLKPESLLELGIGSGEGTRVLLDVIKFNGKGSLTAVDNWHDWGGKRPLDALTCPNLTIVEASEEEFVATATDKYDLIVSDADHYNSHRWIERTLSLLRARGVAFFHDVTNSEFPNLEKVTHHVKQEGYFYRLFNHSSRADESCHRGMLMVFR